MGAFKRCSFLSILVEVPSKVGSISPDECFEGEFLKNVASRASTSRGAPGFLQEAI